MKKLFGIITALCSLLLVAISLSFPPSVSAADVRTGENINLSETQTNLKDLYLFGSNIKLNAPVVNDVVTGGGEILLNGAIANDLLVGGGTVTVRGKIGNNARIAGGTLIIDGPITNDLIITGGTITISKNASIGGDLLFAGGKLDLEGPVHGKILMSGGTVTLNSTVNGNVIGGDVGHLILGPQAKILGNLSYSSNNPAQQETGSQVLGKTDFHLSNKHSEHNATASVVTATFYKLVVDIILSALLIYFFKQGLLVLLTRMKKTPLKSGGIGFAYALLAPIASFICLLFVWLGIASFLVYAFILLISLFVVKIFLGWLLLRLWNKRQKQIYNLDWKAGVIGPIFLFILILIPILGWLILAVILFIAIGALLGELMDLLPKLQGIPRKK